MFCIKIKKTTLILITLLFISINRMTHINLDSEDFSIVACLSSTSLANILLRVFASLRSNFNFSIAQPDCSRDDLKNGKRMQSQKSLMTSFLMAQSI